MRCQRGIRSRGLQSDLLSQSRHVSRGSQTAAIVYLLSHRCGSLELACMLRIIATASCGASYHMCMAVRQSSSGKVPGCSGNPLACEVSLTTATIQSSHEADTRSKAFVLRCTDVDATSHWETLSWRALALRADSYHIVRPGSSFACSTCLRARRPR